MEDTRASQEFVCQKCGMPLPEERREFPWCECGWNLPEDPLDKLSGWKLKMEKLNRWLGEKQAAWDLRWLNRTPSRNFAWVIANAFMYFVGMLFEAGKILFFILVVLTAIAGVIIFFQNCLISLIPLIFSGLILYAWRPYKVWLGEKAKVHLVVHDRVLDAARGVAERMGISAPVIVNFSPWPVLHTGGVLRLLPYPKIERQITVGLPILAALTVTEFKVLIGHSLAEITGLRAVILPAAGNILNHVWRFFRFLTDSFLSLLFIIIFMIIPYGLFLMTIFGGIDVPTYALNVFITFTIPLVSVIIFLGILFWLIATWYRREILLIDRMVAKSFGRNALLQAFPKLWLIQRTFQRQWAGITNDFHRDQEKANLYVKFKQVWDGLPDAYKEKALQEVARDFPKLLYFYPTLSHRAGSLAGIPDRLTDTRPADSLLPGITDTGALITDDLWK